MDNNPEVRGVNAEEPGAILEGPEAVVEEPEAAVEGPEAPVEEPEAVAEELEAFVEGPEAVVEEPEAVAEEPEANVEGPEAVVEEPEAVAEEPEANVEGPEAVVEEPEAVAEEPEANVEGPEAIVEGPDAIVEGPEAIVEGPEAIVEGPEAIVEGLEAIVEGPEAIVEGPEVIAEELQGVLDEAEDQDQVLQQQAGPANRLEPRPSLTLPGTRSGTVVYGDGNGFYYHSERTRNNRRQLRCIYKRSKGCLARASMVTEENAPISSTLNSPFHNHLPDAEVGDKFLMMKRLKDRVREDRGVPISGIFADESARDPDTAASISRLNAVRVMAREKRKSEPPIPQTLQELGESLRDPRFLNMQSTEDGRGSIFLTEIEENGEVVATGFGSRRIIQEMQNHPTEATDMYMDGTFKVVPRRPNGLRQLFSIHILYMNVVFPVVYFLMAAQTEELYTRVLQYVRQNLITWPIQSIMTDFEQGLVNAARNTFIGATLHGCWFHFCQAIWRSVCRFGLVQTCRGDVAVMRVIKMIMALPHLPPVRGPPNSNTIPQHSVTDGWNAINLFIREGNLDGRLLNVMQYVRRFWIRRMGPASFSVFDLPRRTNNNIGSFHAKLLAVFGLHSNIWDFMRRLQRIEQEAFTDFQRLENEIIIRRQRIQPDRLNSPAIRDAIRMLIHREITIVHFLRRLAHRVDNLINVLAHPQQNVQEDLRHEELVAFDEGDLDGDLADEPEAEVLLQREIINAAPANVDAEEEEEEIMPLIPLQPPGVFRAPRRGRRGRPPGRGARERRPRAPRGRRGRGAQDQPAPEAAAPPDRMCIVCLAQPATHIAIPCGHFCMCQICAEELPRHQELQRCPLCNLMADQFFRVW